VTDVLDNLEATETRL